MSEHARDCLVGGGEVGELLRSLDWSTTPLGPVEGWPQSLRTCVSICLGSRHPLEIWWGSEYVRIYNDGYRPILGSNKHPQFLGRPGRECWPEVWPQVGAMLDQVRATGLAVWHEDYSYQLDRHGYIEETFFTFSHGPVRDESGQVAGVLSAVTETTERYVAKRRNHTLRAVGAASPDVTAADEGLLLLGCRAVTAAIEANPYDVPFCLIYLAEEASDELKLMAQAGPIPEADWPLEEVRRERKAQLIEPLLPGPPGGPWPEPVRTAIALPLISRLRPRTLGVLVCGCSPRRPLDDSYRGFFEGLSAQVASSLTGCLAQLEKAQTAEDTMNLERSKREWLERIFAQVPVPIALVLAPYGRFSMVNSRFLEVVGQRILLGRNFRDALPDLEGQGFFEPLEEALRTGEIMDSPSARIVRGGTERFLDLTFAPIKDNTGRVSCVLIHGVDVTGYKRAQDQRERLLATALSARLELQKQRDELETANRSVAEASAALKSQQERQAVLLRFLRSANQASAQLTKGAGHDEVVEILCKTFRNAFGALTCVVYLSDSVSASHEGGFGLRLVGPADAASEGHTLRIALDDPNDLVARVARERKLFSSSVEDWESAFDRGWLEQRGIGAAVLVPLVVRERALGVVASYFRAPLPEEAIAVLAPLCSVAAASFENLSAR